MLILCMIENGVLILVLMEDTFREEEKEGLNNLTLVLILVLMEDTLRVDNRSGQV